MQRKCKPQLSRLSPVFLSDDVEDTNTQTLGSMSRPVSRAGKGFRIPDLHTGSLLDVMGSFMSSSDQ